MPNFGITFRPEGTIGVDEKDIDSAENIFLSACQADVPNAEVLAAIVRDEMAGLDDGVAHFEDGNSAWSLIQARAVAKVEAHLGYALPGAALILRFWF